MHDAPPNPSVPAGLTDYSMMSSNWAFDALRTAAFQAIRLELSEDDFVRLVLLAPLGRDYLAEKPSHTEVRLEGRARQVYKWCDEHFDYGSESIQEKLADMVGWVFRQQWSAGKAGVNEKAACIAILARCQELGAYSPNVSARWLASQLGMSNHHSADRLRQRLVDAGFMTFVASTRRYGNQYRVNLEAGQKCVTRTTNKLYRYNLFVVVLMQNDLGPVPAWVYCLMDDTTAAEAAEVLGVSKATVDRALRTLVRKGLMEKQGRRYVRTDLEYEPGPIENRFAHEQALNREAVEEGFRNRQAKEINYMAELEAAAWDDWTGPEVEDALPDGIDPFDDVETYLVPQPEGSNPPYYSDIRIKPEALARLNA